MCDTFVAHIFWCTYNARTFRTFFMRVTHKHGSLFALRISSSLFDFTFSVLMFHPSLFLCCALTVTSRPFPTATSPLLPSISCQNFPTSKRWSSAHRTRTVRSHPKEAQKQKEEERVVFRSRLAAMNPPSSTATRTSSASNPIASSGPENTAEKPDSRVSIVKFDAASTSQVRLKDAHLCGVVEKQRGNPSHQEEEDSEDSDNPEAEIWYYE